MGDALVDGQLMGNRRLDPKGFIGTVALDGTDVTEGFDDAGKHKGANFGFLFKGFQFSGNWRIFAAQ